MEGQESLHSDIPLISCLRKHRAVYSVILATHMSPSALHLVTISVCNPANIDDCGLCLGNGGGYEGWFQFLDKIEQQGFCFHNIPFIRKAEQKLLRNSIFKNY